MKNNKLIILLLLFFIMPMFVKADMSAPMSSYKIRISNPEGAEVYEWNNKTRLFEKTGEKIDYDLVYIVQYEQIINNEIYAHITRKSIDDKGKVTYSDIKLIKLDDTRVIEIDIEDYEKEMLKKYYVFDDTCYLYKGPSKLYGKIEPEISLSVGTIIETEYYDELWAYVEYNGVKGWVYTYTFTTLSPYNESAGMVSISEYHPNIKSVNELTLYNNPKTEEETGVTIHPEVELNTIYTYSSEVHNPYYYVDYNGTKGWVKTIYEDNVIMNIAYKANQEMSLKVDNKEGAALYKNPSNKNSSIGIIPYETKLTPTYSLNGSHTEEWYQVKYNDTIGWVNLQDVSYYNEDNSTIPEQPTKPDDVIDTEVNTNQTNNSINEKIIYYVCGAVILSLTAVVTILLVNKKKKEKNANK